MVEDEMYYYKHVCVHRIRGRMSRHTRARVPSTLGSLQKMKKKDFFLKKQKRVKRKSNRLPRHPFATAPPPPPPTLDDAATAFLTRCASVAP